MGLYKRDKVWWMAISHKGQQIRRSCETTSKNLAEDIFCKVKTQITERGDFLTQERQPLRI